MKKILSLLLAISLLTQPSYGILSDLANALVILTEMNLRNLKTVYENIIKPHWPTPGTVKDDFQWPYTFADLAGEIPQDVLEITDFIKNREKYTAIGAQMIKGILLYGPGGTGKTSIARAIAGETNAAFFTASGSDFIEMYVGVGPQRIRELFDRARQALCEGYTNAIIFIDEIDAIGGSRSFEPNSEYRNTLNELLKQMDGFTQESGIFVIAATNNINLLDKALLRPGRFDRLVEIPLPNLKSREEILRHYIKKINYKGTGEFLTTLAQQTINMNGAELKSIINEAAIFAVRENIPFVTDKHLEMALKKALEQKKRR